MNHWTFLDIVHAYKLSETECLQVLLRLDKLLLINLLPGNRIRLNLSRDFDWLPNGPIRHYFRSYGLAEFLDSTFNLESEAFSFTHGMLTESAISKLQIEMRHLRRKFAELHEESLLSPLPKICGTGLLLAMREWEPNVFKQFRR